ncbi:Gfo/Idh/MocA family protein [Tichowtungia aerotolerans]|uniref:Gfo/Idh/MocA family oxidoreductase n=1 Tax=Tichowtungia aerotolerans TaxID=2697043 RepID=A0A6P1M374_9BACT|nr:Gfo/Idh/MocA family oxidoreductase [Tichowtungia aerotolerans]QHI69289.1 Gfo/Idh/MocA family oxidoreductase [Tichowtungia aerotolerans]
MNQSEKISMAAVGLFFGEHLIKEIVSGRAEPYISLCGVCDLNAELASEVAERYDTRVYASLDEILADPEIESVGLFTPPAGRAELIRKIIRAGKHVMTTKPFEVDADEALSVLQEARSLGKAVHLNSPSALPDPETAQILQWQQEFDLGQPVGVRWETYSSLREKADGSWQDDPERCPVAPIFRLGIYGINQLLRLCGTVEAVHVMHSRIFTGRPTPDNAELSLRFSSGALASVFVSFCIDDGHRLPDVLTLHYKRGTVRVRALEVDAGMFVTAKELLLQMRQEDGAVLNRRIEMFDYGPLNNYQWKNFHSAVRNGGTVDGEVSPEQVAHSIWIISAMRTADQTGAQVLIDG